MAPFLPWTVMLVSMVKVVPALPLTEQGIIAAAAEQHGAGAAQSLRTLEEQLAKGADGAIAQVDSAVVQGQAVGRGGEGAIDGHQVEVAVERHSVQRAAEVRKG